MKTNILKYGLLAIVAGMVMSGCDDFLDTEQLGVTSQDDFYQTDDEALEALYGVYDKLQADQVSNFQYKNVLSDDGQAGGASRSDNSDGNQLNEFTISPSNSVLETMFSHYYKMIYCANILIEKVEADTDTKILCIAEAKFLRAYAYFELVTLWGPVPLVLETLDVDNYNQPNSTISELWAQIELDLEEAIPVLPLKSEQSDAEKARASKGAAQSLLGKAYLYQEKYDEAADMFDTVINSGEYSLYPDFSMLTREVSEFGVESIFEISYVADRTSSSESTQIHAYCGPRSGYFSAGTTGLSESGWGFVNPLPGLREVFVEEGDEIRWKATVLNEEDLEEYGASIRAADGNLPYGNDGLVRMKYGAFLDEIAESEESYHEIGGTNYRLIRYGDVLLMAAEAHNRKASPNDTKALSYINEVRDRVSLPHISVTGDELFEAIKKERRMELAFEFVRFQDLVRWGDAETALADQGKTTSLGTYVDGVEQFYTNENAGFKSYNNLMPFPDSEITVNPNITQNPGY